MLRTRRGNRWAAPLAGALGLALTLVGAVPAPATPGLSIALSAVTGTPSFDTTDGFGFDSSGSNNIIRTNDQVTYRVNVAANLMTGGRARLTFTLPRGQEFRDVPAWCDDPADPTRDARPTPAMAAPAAPLTGLSWLSLPQQTLTCAIGDLPDATTKFFEIPAFQRAEVPNGTVLPTAVATISTSTGASTTSFDNVSMVVSAGPRWDLSKNGVNLQENSFTTTMAPVTCQFDAEQRCFNVRYPVLISGPNGGKGSTPLMGPVTFTDQLNPTSFYGAAVTSSAAWAAAGAQAAQRYAPRLVGCGANHIYGLPGENLAAGTAKDSVRNSGSMTCTQAAPGADATITVTNADWSLYTYPDQLKNPTTPIPDNRAYAVVGYVRVEMPVAAALDLGTKVGTATTLNTHNVYGNLQAMGLDGRLQPGGVDPTWNNYLDLKAVITPPGAFDKWFAGVPGQPLNTNRLAYVPGAGTAEGLPGSTTYRSGATIAGAGQDVISLLTVRGSQLTNSAPGAGLLCDTWDNSRLQLHAGNYPASSTGAPSQLYPSGGKAVWYSGQYFLNKAPTHRVEYSSVAAPGAAASDCRTGVWVDSPELVPGNDPALAAQGIYTAVNRVRIYTILDEPTPAATSATGQFFSIALRVVPGQQAGDIMPNWAGSTLRFGKQYTMEELLPLTPALSNYQPAAHTGSLGDRLIFGPAYVRVAKTVLSGGKEVELSNATSGDQVTWRMTPKLSSAATAAIVKQPVVLEDCLPAGFQYESASVTPSRMAPAPAPAGAGVTCAAGTTYIRFDLGDYLPNAVIPPVDLVTRISTLAQAGTFTNTVTIQSTPADPATPAQRTDTAQVNIQQSAGLKLDKVALTPLVQVNRTGSATLQENVWRVDVANLNVPENVSNLDVIDVLPVRSGTGGSQFSGTMQFRSASVTTGDNVRILYTRDPSVVTNPDAASNGASGIAWCSAPAGGTPVRGTGACPASAAEVTGLRFLRPGPFLSGAQVSVEVRMVAQGNAENDVYANAAEASIDGLTFNVGPVARPERVVGSSVGDRVWLDADNDGLQGSGEGPLAGFPVRLTGTDDLGNPVDLRTQTDVGGNYLFANLRAGTYRVTFDPAGLPAQHVFTKQGQGNDRAIDSDGDPVTGTTATFTLGQNQDRLDIDQGVFWTARTIRLAKAGSACDVDRPTCPIGGAQFAVYATDPSVVGAQPIGTMTVDQTGPAGWVPGSTFTSPPLTLQTAYWLVETRAVPGFQLLADPIPFTVTLNGIALTPAAGIDNGTVVAVDGADRLGLVVTDQRAGSLPEAGGQGQGLTMLLGLTLVVAAGLIHHLQTSGTGFGRRRSS